MLRPTVMFLYRKFYWWLLSLTVTACIRPENEPKPGASSGNFSNGILVLNEGTFGFGNAGLTFISLSENKIYPDVYRSVNDQRLGDQAQHMFEHIGKIYISVQNSGYVEVLDKQTMRRRQRIVQTAGQMSPRFGVGHENAVYIADWAADAVHVVDAETFEIKNSLPTFEDPEYLFVDDTKLYIACAAYSRTQRSENRVLVYHLSEKRFIDTFQVADRPVFIEKYGDDALIVGCMGFRNLSSGAFRHPSLMLLNKVTGEIIKTIRLAADSSTYFAAKNFLKPKNENKVWFLQQGHIWAVDLATFQPSIMVRLSNPCYGLNLDTKEQLFMLGIIHDFTSPGKLLRMRTDGRVVDSFQVGVLPNFSMRFFGGDVY